MGEAANISLKAIGMQDTHLLSKDPEDSLFHYNDHPRHSEFRKYHNVYTVPSGVEDTWPFGQTVRVELNPKNMGDLLNNVWIQMKLPDWNFQDITFNETVQKILFGGLTLAEYGFDGEPEVQFRNWWLAGAPNVVGIVLPIYSFPDFKSFLSFENQFNSLLLQLLPGELFLTIPANVLLVLLEILAGTITGSQELLDELGVVPGKTPIPDGIIEILRGDEDAVISEDVIRDELDADIYNLFPDLVKQIVTGQVDPPRFDLPEIADWAWDMQLLGRKIIKNIKFKVGNQILEEITADWCIIKDNLYMNDSQKMASNTLYNRNIVGGETSQPSGQKAAQSNELFIHIPFFFSHNYAGDIYSENNGVGASFPLCAIHNQKITLEIEFFKQSFFTLYNQREKDNGTSRGIPKTPPAKKMPNFKIVTEETTLSHEERMYFTQPNKEIFYDFMFKHSSIPLDPQTRQFVVQLEPNVPVKCFHWFFRYEGYEDEDEYRSLPVDDPSYVNEWFYSTTANRFNFTRSQIKDTDEPHILKNAYFVLNEERIPNVSNNDREYFFSYVPLRTRLSRSATDVTRTYNYEPPSPNYLFNYVYSYNFAMFPKSVSPSGFLDFSSLDSEKTKFYMELVDDISLQYGNGARLENPEYKFHMYYTGYKKLTFNNGFLLQT
jgi:hypothetical protein